MLFGFPCFRLSPFRHNRVYYTYGQPLIFDFRSFNTALKKDLILETITPVFPRRI